MVFLFLAGLVISLLCPLLLTNIPDIEDVAIIGPALPVCAIQGGEVTLSCNLTPQRNAEEINVTWTKEEASPIVHFYSNGTECDERQKEKYKGRTEMIRNDVNGTVTLKIHNIIPCDAGKYTCSFTSGIGHVNTTAEFELKVPEELIKERDSLQRFKEWRQARSYADDVTLDPDTSHPLLVVSVDRRSVRRSYTAQDQHRTPARYDTYSCVLGMNRITSGRHYWEVEVGGVLWYVGVCDEHVSRKGQIGLSPETGYWAVGVWYGDGFWAFTSPKSALPSRVLPKTVGIFLDYEYGRITFYNIEERSEILTFPLETFTQTLRPFFCTWLTNPPLIVRSFQV